VTAAAAIAATVTSYYTNTITLTPRHVRLHQARLRHRGFQNTAHKHRFMLSLDIVPRKSGWKVEYS
jgi:hypothetical protein